MKELTDAYRAHSFSTTRLPLAGQNAGGIPWSEGRGSCSISKYCCTRSKLQALRHGCDISKGWLAYYLGCRRSLHVTETLRPGRSLPWVSNKLKVLTHHNNIPLKPTDLCVNFRVRHEEVATNRPYSRRTQFGRHWHHRHKLDTHQGQQKKPQQGYPSEYWSIWPNTVRLSKLSNEENCTYSNSKRLVRLECICLFS